MTARLKLAFLVGLVVASVAIGLIVANVLLGLPLARTMLAVEISPAGFVVQMVALTVGVIVVNSVPESSVRVVLVLQGAVCLGAWGLPAALIGLVLVSFWALFAAVWLGWLRFALALALFIAIDATVWLLPDAVGWAFLFNAVFAMRLFVFAYDRWQRRDEPTPLLDFLAYMLPAPFLILPPYMAVIPMFDGFQSRVQPSLSRERLAAIARHAVLAAMCTGLSLAWTAWVIQAEPSQPVAIYARLIGSILELGVIAHLLISMLLLHGIELSSPIERPLLSTSMVELWHRFGSHLKDVQMFLFYTPALLRLRRLNRYVAIVLATGWTMIIGNTLIHIAARYCFLASPWDRIGWGLVANAVIWVALSYDLCHREWRNRHGIQPSRSLLRLAIGWAITMTIAAIVAWL